MPVPVRLFQAIWLLVFAIDALASDDVAPVEFSPAKVFGQLPAGWTLGACSAVAIGPADEVYVFHRGQHPILCFDSEGKFQRSFGDDEIHTAHGLRVDADGALWATDIGNHRVFKFESAGKLLLTLGTGQPGSGREQFDRPTDVAFGPQGAIYVADGYGNSRVVQFSPSGAYLREWGRKGKRLGEFNLPHAALFDPQGRLLIGDRENNRIQIFDADGKFQQAWRGPAPYGLAQDRDGNLFLADGRANKVLLLSQDGKVRQSWGGPGTAPGRFSMPHMLALDSEGNLYVAEVNGRRVQKFARQPAGR
ncbi:MAG: peptidyl-alpha-hydroxyglycine alpha-amidating lyase family protein [Pirellulaceae bacterium]|nr:peptidyl-alpha-hydroxyglycine alpha-amidating lyase family protein [Pirellulaceae bacterium]